MEENTLQPSAEGEKKPQKTKSSAKKDTSKKNTAKKTATKKTTTKKETAIRHQGAGGVPALQVGAGTPPAPW